MGGKEPDWLQRQWYRMSPNDRRQAVKDMEATGNYWGPYKHLNRWKDEDWSLFGIEYADGNETGHDVPKTCPVGEMYEYHKRQAERETKIKKDPLIKFEQWSKDFWEYIGEKPNIYSPVQNVTIDLPITRVFKKRKWIPLSETFVNRLQEFISTDGKIQQGSELLISLAKLAFEYVTTNGTDDSLVNKKAKWAETFLGLFIGQEPRARKSQAEEQSYNLFSEQDPRGTISHRVPVESHREWEIRRDSACHAAHKFIEVMLEYLLRHVIKIEELTLEDRNKILEYYARSIFIVRWKSYFNLIDFLDVGKSTSLTVESLRKFDRNNLPDVISEAVKKVRYVSSIATCDFSAISSVVGPELPILTKMLEAQATQKINTQVECAISEFEKFRKSVLELTKMGTMRENINRFECKILKYKVSIHVSDVGEGLIITRKIADGGREIGLSILIYGCTFIIIFIVPIIGLILSGISKIFK